MIKRWAERFLRRNSHYILEPGPRITRIIDPSGVMSFRSDDSWAEGFPSDWIFDDPHL